jgi:hypothetical protein
MGFELASCANHNKEDCPICGIYALMNPLERMREVEALGRTRRALQTLANNLKIAGALAYSYKLGMSSCWCDQGPRGNEWYPGSGVTPEEIENREWNDDPHLFEPGDVKAPPYDQGGPHCVQCGMLESNWRHES